MTGTIIAALLAFAATNIDDLFINMFFFAQADTMKKAQQIVVGKYLGISALFLLSLLGAWFAHALPYGALLLLGIVPIALGVKACFSSGQDADISDQPSFSGMLMLNAALITIANGSDNLGVYIPLLASYDTAQVVVTAAVFVLLTAVWCLLSERLAALPLLCRLLTRYRRIAVPIVLIALGVYILL